MITNVKEKQKEYKNKRDEERRNEILAFFEQLKEIILNDVGYIENCVVANSDYVFFRIREEIVPAPFEEEYPVLKDLIYEIDLGEVRLLFDGIFRGQYGELDIRCCWELVNEDIEKNDIEKEEEKEEWNLWKFLFSWLK